MEHVHHIQQLVYVLMHKLLKLKLNVNGIIQLMLVDQFAVQITPQLNQIQNVILI